MTWTTAGGRPPGDTPAPTLNTAAAAAAAPCLNLLSGQLTEAQFGRAMRCFSQWWQWQCPHHPAWVLQSRVMPVTQQVEVFLQMDRVLAAGHVPPQQQQHSPQAPAVAAPASLACPDRQQQQQIASPTARKASLGGFGPPADSSWGLGPGSSTACCAGSSSDARGGDGGRGSHACGDGCSSSSADSIAEAYDEACALPCCGSAHEPPRQQHLHRYTVVWHGVYCVPVLYLEAQSAGGLPLTLPELCLDLPQLHLYKDDGQEAWTYITPVAHPVTGDPAHMLHPCQTPVRMQLLLQHTTLLSSQQTSPPTPTHSAAAAAAATGTAAALGLGSAACHVDSCDLQVDQLLLLYAQGWFSMVAPLLGLSMLEGPSSPS